MLNNLSLADQVYIVFGATGGIGSCIVKQLTELGARVVLAARTEEKLAGLAKSLNSKDFFALDVTQAQQVEHCLQSVKEKYQKISGVTNCVGSILLKPAHLTTDDEWQQTLSLNLTSAFNVVRAAAKYIDQSGSVVLLSSSAAKVGLPNHEAIAAAKAGIHGLVLSAAATYATRRLRFNAIAPGLVRTPLAQRLLSNPASEKASIANHPLGRIGEPEEIARLLVWLLSPQSDWISGQIFAMDGGMSSLRARVSI